MEDSKISSLSVLLQYPELGAERYASEKSRLYDRTNRKQSGLRSGLLYAFASKRSLLLYANGQILHAYDYVNHMHYEKDLGDQITFIKFDPYGNNYDELMVGTYNAAEKGIVTQLSFGH